MFPRASAVDLILAEQRAQNTNSEQLSVYCPRINEISEYTVQQPYNPVPQSSQLHRCLCVGYAPVERLAARGARKCRCHAIQRTREMHGAVKGGFANMRLVTGHEKLRW